MAIDTEKQKTDGPTEPAEGTPARKSNKKVLIIVLSIVGVLIVLSIIGSMLVGFLFKKGAESFIDIATDGNVKVDTGKDGGTVTISGEDGDEIKTKVGNNATLPDDFPKSEVPIYKNAKIVGSTDVTIEGTQAFAIQLLTNDSISEVNDFYKDKLSGDDWERIASTNTISMSTSMYRSKSKQLAVTVTSMIDKGDTNISLSVRLSYDK